MRKNNYGREYEGQVSDYIQSLGMKIIERNFTVRGGEIDIIALDGEYICFIEVKYRSARAIDAYRSVGGKKQQFIIKAAERYLYENKRSDYQPRFDAVFLFSDGGELTFDYIKNAFNASGY